MQGYSVVEDVHTIKTRCGVYRNCLALVAVVVLRSTPEPTDEENIPEDSEELPGIFHSCSSVDDLTPSFCGCAERDNAPEMKCSTTLT